MLCLGSASRKGNRRDQHFYQSRSSSDGSYTRGLNSKSSFIENLITSFAIIDKSTLMKHSIQ